MATTEITARALLCGLVVGLLGCDAPDKRERETTSQATILKEGKGDMEITSTAFTGGSAIPRRFTCDGDDLSPELSWKGVPGTAKSLALIVEDPDAPDPKAPKTTWTHWILYDIPNDTNGLAEAISKLPGGTREGLNDWKKTGYRGPCPPIGRHRYFFKLYALDRNLGDLSNPNRAKLLEGMSGHIVGNTELMGTYQKQ